MKQSSKWLLIVLAIALVVIPLVFIVGEYGGADDAAGDVIEENNPDYEPWFDSIFEPKSGEIESLLFALQAAIGAIVIGYFFGYYKGKKSVKEPARK